MHHSGTCAFALVVATLALGCSTPPASPVSPSEGNGSAALTADALAGTWPLQSVQAAGQPERAVPASASYQVTFSDGRASARADCNVCSGSIAVAGNTVTIGPALACTRAACSTADFEASFVDVLAGQSVAQFDGVELRLTSDRGVLRFRR